MLWNTYLFQMNTVFLNEFLVGFGDDRTIAERIIHDACVETRRLPELQAELSQLYLQKFQLEDPAKCCTAIMYAFSLRSIKVYVSRASLPILEIDQTTVLDTASSLSTQSNVPSTDSPAGMSLDSRNVAMGSVTHSPHIVQDTDGPSDVVMGSTTRN